MPVPSEKPSEKPHSYLVWTIIKTGEDLGAVEIFSEIGGGIVIAILARICGLANRTELKELIFLCIGGAIIAPLFGFLIRFLFITPAKIHRDDEAEKETLKKIHDKQMYQKNSEIQKMAMEIKSLQDTHKRRFIAFMAQLKEEVVNTEPAKWMEFYQNKIPNIEFETALIAPDFQPNERVSFEASMSSLCDKSIASSAANRPRVLSMMGAISAFVKYLPNYG
jgi:hypothetical protein